MIKTLFDIYQFALIHLKNNIGTHKVALKFNDNLLTCDSCFIDKKIAKNDSKIKQETRLYNDFALHLFNNHSTLRKYYHYEKCKNAKKELALAL